MNGKEARALLRSFPWAPVAISLFLLVSIPRLFFDPTDPFLLNFAAASAMALTIMGAWASIADWLRGGLYND